MTARTKSRMERKYSPEKGREQDPDYRHSAFTSIGSVADYTKNTECLKFQLFCLFSTALWTLIFTFVYWEIIASALLDKKTFPSSQSWKSLIPHPCSKKGHLGQPLLQGLNAMLWPMWCKQDLLVHFSKLPPVSSQFVLNPVLWLHRQRRWDYPTLNFIRFHLFHFSVCVKDELYGSSSISCSNYFPQLYVACELIWGYALTHRPSFMKVFKSISSSIISCHIQDLHPAVPLIPTSWAQWFRHFSNPSHCPYRLHAYQIV